MLSAIIKVTKHSLCLKNGIEVDVSLLKAKISAYLELQDRIIIKLWTAVDAKKEQAGYDLCRNIFCYSKEDGSLIWQVEQAYHPDTREPLDEVFKNLKLYIKQDDGSYERFSDLKEYPWDDVVAGNSYHKSFRVGVDRLSSMTWSQFPQEYWIDYETGKLEWFAFHQKI